MPLNLRVIKNNFVKTFFAKMYNEFINVKPYHNVNLNSSQMSEKILN